MRMMKGWRAQLSSFAPATVSIVQPLRAHRQRRPTPEDRSDDQVAFATLDDAVVKIGALTPPSLQARSMASLSRLESMFHLPTRALAALHRRA